jgi:hypothetical protein
LITAKMFQLFNTAIVRQPILKQNTWVKYENDMIEYMSVRIYCGSNFLWDFLYI